MEDTLGFRSIDRGGTNRTYGLNVWKGGGIFFQGTRKRKELYCVEDA